MTWSGGSGRIPMFNATAYAYFCLGQSAIAIRLTLLRHHYYSVNSVVLFMFCVCFVSVINLSDWSYCNIVHPIKGQLSNDANMAGVDTMCSGYDASEVSFVFVH